MSNPTITVNLSSLDEGTIPTVTSSVNVNEGGNLDVTVTWPSSASNTISCDLSFANSGDQDPFNDEVAGDTSFPMTRVSSTASATHTLAVENDAEITSDTYDLTLTIDGQTFTKDPSIVIKPS